MHAAVASFGLLAALSAPAAGVARVDAMLKECAEARIFSGDVLIARGDEVLLHEQYGFSDWPSRTPLGPNGIFKIGSVTKQFTAAAILRLEEKGLLSTTDPIAKMIPELPKQLTQQGGVDVTIHHLATHTSGLPDPLLGNVWGKERGFEVILSALSGAQLRHTPGAEFHYNSTGYMLLGEIIRRASGVSFEKFLRDELFTPLGMSRTGIKPTPTQARDFVPGHVSVLFGLAPSKEVFGRFITGDYDWDVSAGGNVFSSAGDLHTWMGALEAGKVLSSASMEKMLKPDLHDYGYGWVIKHRPGVDEPLYWHNGAIIPFGYRSDVAWTKSRLHIVLLSNLDDTAAADNLFDNVVRVLAGETPEAPKAGLRVKPAYGIVQLLGLLLWNNTGLFVLAAYVAWTLGRVRYKSKMAVYTAVVGAGPLALLALAFFWSPWGALATVATGLLAGRLVHRSRDLRLYHQKKWRQRLELGAAVLGAVFSVGLAVVIFRLF